MVIKQLLICLVVVVQAALAQDDAPLQCPLGQTPQTRRFNFLVESYTTMGPACRDCPGNSSACLQPQCVTADGVSRSFVSVNRHLPGPTIRVCDGDRVEVLVINRVSDGSELTVHWHGLHMRGTPYMDGVPMVTQCPIHEMNAFRYTFNADQVGTHFWHAHNGLHAMDGMAGPLIVQARGSPNQESDNVIFLQEWFHQPAIMRFPGPRPVRIRGQHPDSILINGRGIHKDKETAPSARWPLAEVKLVAGARNLLRIIHSSGLECPLLLQVEDHDLEVVATEAGRVLPEKVDALVTVTGERFDVVPILKTNFRRAAYWITVRGLGECESKQIYTLSVLAYQSGVMPSTPDPGYAGYNVTKIMNPEDAERCENGKGICTYQLKNAEVIDDALRTAIVKRLDIKFKFHYFSHEDLFANGLFDVHGLYYIPPGDEEEYEMESGVINNISFVMPSSPLLGKPINTSAFCRSRSRKAYRRCLHVQSLPLRSVLDLVLIHDDNAPEPHSFHLHGHRFLVLYQGKNLTQALSTTMENCVNPPFKDTLLIPGEGVARVRFLADNPGYWMFHCHMLFHERTGMALLFHTGEDSDLPPVPHNFPTCGNFNS